MICRKQHKAKDRWAMSFGFCSRYFKAIDWRSILTVCDNTMCPYISDFETKNDGDKFHDNLSLMSWDLFLFSPKNRWVMCIDDLLEIRYTSSRIYSMILLSFACHIEGLVQDRSNSIANALEILQSCSKASISNVHISGNLGLFGLFIRVLPLLSDLDSGVASLPISRSCSYRDKHIQTSYTTCACGFFVLQ